MTLFFILGKGGAGKSTLSSLLALHLCNSGKKVVLTSLDPAHNLSDIFETGLSEKETTIKDGLYAIETDMQLWIRNFLKDAENNLKKSYSYLTTFSMEKNFSVLQHAPALEEYAMLMAFNNILQKFKTADILIFDMPPTALAIKFFSLPQVSLVWLNSLASIRKEILEKQKIISQLRLGDVEAETDKVKRNIEDQINFWIKIDSMFRDNDLCRPIIVENPDTLSQAETSRIEEKLKSLNTAMPLKAINKATGKPGLFDIVIPDNLQLNGLKHLEKSIQKINFDKIV